MNCPPAISDVILDILTCGLLRSRVSGEFHLSALEADHLHNLPAMVKNYRPELLRFYWEVERTSFIEGCSRNNISIANFQPLWDSLSEVMKELNEPAIGK